MIRKRVFTLESEYRGMLICLHMSDELISNPLIVEHLKSILVIFNRRFASPVMLGMAGFVPLTPRVLTEWLQSGLIEQSICSAQENFTLNDLTDAAVRIHAKAVMFIDVKHLLADLSKAIRFIIENNGHDGTPYRSNCGAYFYTPISRLSSIPRPLLHGDWMQRIDILEAICRRDGDPFDRNGQSKRHLNTVTNDSFSIANRHFFATRTGVERFGGVANLNTLPLLTGGARLDSFQRWWLLDKATYNEAVPESVANSTTVSIGNIPMISEYTSAKQCVVFDIFPAPHNFGPALEMESLRWINVPRQIVIGRRYPNSLTVAKVRSDAEAVFIASNYNKSRYLHASIYSLMMQTYANISVEVADDLSTDDSVAQIQNFKQLMDVPDNLIRLRRNIVNRGTYWIRNDIISKYRQRDVVLFINDSDDFSSAMRATLQISTLQSKPPRDCCFFNIVRVNSNYAPLPLNGEVERYGTASLCFTPQLISRVGYFQNIKKNADTEFIERVKRFEGKDALPRVLYPVLYQPFDGENLTADIYTLANAGGTIVAGHGLRNEHKEIFRQHHAKLNTENLAIHFGFPLSTLPRDYTQLGSEFLLDGYHEQDGFIVLLFDVPNGATVKVWQKLGVCVLYRDLNLRWVFHSRKHERFICDFDLSTALFEYAQRHEPHAYLVVETIFAKPIVGQQDTSAILAEIIEQWIYRSKSEGDRWAYTRSGIRIKPQVGLRLFEAMCQQDNHIMRQGETAILLHTSALLKREAIETVDDL